MIAVKILVLVHVHDEHIEIAFAVLTVQQVAEILDIAGLALLGDDAVTDVVVPLFVGGLRRDLIFDLDKVLGMHHAGKGALDIVVKVLVILAAEELHHVVVGKGEIFLALRLIDEGPAGQPGRYSGSQLLIHWQVLPSSSFLLS